MARQLRIEFPGAVYHITSRGNAKQPIFLDDGDRKDFLDRLCSVVRRSNWLCHAYCLMNNHYHLLIETPEANLSRGMRQLNGEYTITFNRKHKRVGHLFQGRYKAILVDKDNYLLSLCRYIALNPIRAGLVKDPGEWKWSSYSSTIGNDNKHGAFLTVDWILSQFDEERGKAVRKYRDFITGGGGEESPWKALKGQILLGNADFVEKFAPLLRSKGKMKEVPRAQRYVARPALADLLDKGEIEGDKQRRDRLIFDAYIRYGYTMEQIAQQLGVHYTAISRAVKRVERKEEKML